MKRELQWGVVMAALADAGADEDTVKLVQFARNAGDMVRGMTSMLVGSADTAAAKNYVKVEMVGLVPPFERAYVELVRPGGKTSHELRELLRDRLTHVRYMLSEGDLSDARRQGIMHGIDEDLAKERP
jgi:hypothetical protein